MPGRAWAGPDWLRNFPPCWALRLTTIGQAFIPGETIQTGNAMRYETQFWVRRNILLAAGPQLPFAGSYGLLDFADAGYVNSHMLNAQAGYDYLLDPTNSIAIIGSYGKIDLTYNNGLAGSNSLTGSISDYTAAFAYGKKITGRLAFQIAVGPQQIRAAEGNGTFNLWLTSVNTALSYQRRRSSFFLNYAHGVGGGSGVYFGSKADTISSTGNYQFTRYWSGSINGGFAFNKSLAPAGDPTSNFNNWFIGANLGHRLGTHALINFNYGVQRQGINICPVANCGVNGLTQTFGMTVNWHLNRIG